MFPTTKVASVSYAIVVAITEELAYANLQFNQVILVRVTISLVHKIGSNSFLQSELVSEGKADDSHLGHALISSG